MSNDKQAEMLRVARQESPAVAARDPRSASAGRSLGDGFLVTSDMSGAEQSINSARALARLVIGSTRRPVVRSLKIISTSRGAQ